MTSFHAFVVVVLVALLGLLHMIQWALTRAGAGVRDGFVDPPPARASSFLRRLLT